MSNLKISGIVKSAGGGSSYLDVDLIEEIGDNFIRYANGKQICFGYTNWDSLGVKWDYVILPKPFINADYVVVTAYKGTNSTTTISYRAVSVTEPSTTQFRLFCGNQQYWVAIGDWK